MSSYGDSIDDPEDIWYSEEDSSDNTITEEATENIGDNAPYEEQLSITDTEELTLEEAQLYDEHYVYLKKLLDIADLVYKYPDGEIPSSEVLEIIHRTEPGYSHVQYYPNPNVAEEN